MPAKKLKFIFFIPVLLFFASFLFHSSEDFKEDQLIIWSVGQGQMVTYLSHHTCHHFDMGGESFPKKKIFKLCKNKKNKVHYTHWDQDHINFSLQAKRIFPSLCRVTSLRQRLPLSRKKRWMIQRIPPCTAQHYPDIRELFWPENVRLKNSNESSRVFIIKKRVLIPGDSSQRMEKYWSSLVKDPIQILIAGHHGSFSSTSSFLLNHLPHLNLAIASARRKRYGHPHFQTVQRLNKRGVRLLSTEDFNHIRIPLKKGKAVVRFF